jgi:recombinational DNA repair protein (RecF pathway)
MRHKYVTRAVVLQRTPVREQGLLLALLTEDFGLVRARAEGLRKPGAKLASSLQTLCECEVTLVRGKDGWRLVGALLNENKFRVLAPTARACAARVASLVLRLVPADIQESAFFVTYSDFLNQLNTSAVEDQDGIECTTALSLLTLLGLDSGPVVENMPRTELVMRINRGIAASGL